MPAAIEVREPKANGGMGVEEAVWVSPRVERPRLPERPLFADSLLDFGKSERNRGLVDFSPQRIAVQRRKSDYRHFIHRKK
jgi:hypothetical protein